MPLLSIKELSMELSIPIEFIQDLIDKQLLTPYGGRARLGEPRFSTATLSKIKKKIETLLPSN